jgi:hypothetical protein
MSESGWDVPVVLVTYQRRTLGSEPLQVSTIMPKSLGISNEE